MNSGVYKIENLVDNKVYIGSSKNILKRFARHKNQLHKNLHHCSYLQNAYNKYGKEKFRFSVIEYCSIEDLLCKEQYYIDALSPEYNVLKVAGSPTGYKHTDESKKKMVIARSKRVLSEKEMDRIKSGFHKGYKHTEETKKRLSDASKGNKNRLGAKLSQETKDKISESLKNRCK